MASSRDVEDQIVASIRRVIRAIDLQSKRLLDSHALTGPQLATLREAHRMRAPSTSALARAVHLSQPTVSGIVSRLERQGLVARERSADDRRTVVVSVTERGREVLGSAPSLLQDRFRAELERLAPWEQHWLLAALERIAAMMDAEDLEAAPILETGHVGPPADDEGL
ncbi:MAG: MarR family transcriptional regulator [Myxococcota bacterium]|nr:MarR family transcriptional regulator [Myxococcales bacterium]